MSLKAPIMGKKWMAELGERGNETAVAPMSAFAMSQMEKMGWKNGKGLGKHETGISTYVRVAHKKDTVGIGGNKLVAEDTSQWWCTAFDSAAATFHNTAATKHNKKSKKKKKMKLINSDTFTPPTDAELFEATGGKLFGRRAYGSCVGKLKRDAAQIGGEKSEKKKKKRKREKTEDDSNKMKDICDEKTEEDGGVEKKDRKKKKSKKKKV